MKLLDKIYSLIDKTIKYVFQLDSGLISEVAYIDNNSGKDIICVSTHTSCNLGCKFCHTSDCQGKVKVNYLVDTEIVEQVGFVYQDLNLGKRMLLVSFMGCGEPLENDYLSSSMLEIKKKFKPCRFAVATLIPRHNWMKFFFLAEDIKRFNLDVKIHLSLHFTDDKTREEWMPAALPIEPAIAALDFYQKMGGNVEIHYTLIEGVNDKQEHAYDLVRLLNSKNIPVKLLKYNERPTIDNKASGKVHEFMGLICRASEIYCSPQKVEYYEPPGKGVGASCGEFLLDYYMKYNSTDK